MIIGIRLLILFLSLILGIEANATVAVVRYPSGTPVQVCQASDSNTSCGGSSTSGLTYAITQTAHGFSVGNVVYFNGTIYVKAKADVASTSDAVGLVTTVTDANNFTLTLGGVVTTLSGLTAGNVYFLSDATAGLLSTTEPTTTNHVSKPLLVATSTTAGYFINWRGMVVGSGISGSGAANKVTFWSGGGTLSSNTNFHWDNSNTRLGIGNAAPTKTLDVTGAGGFSDTVQVTGYATSPSGSGLELGYTGGIGYLTSYNRTGGAYLPLNIRGSEIRIQRNGTDVLRSLSTEVPNGVRIGGSVDLGTDYVLNVAPGTSVFDAPGILGGFMTIAPPGSGGTTANILFNSGVSPGAGRHGISVGPADGGTSSIQLTADGGSGGSVALKNGQHLQFTIDDTEVMAHTTTGVGIFNHDPDRALNVQGYGLFSGQLVVQTTATGGNAGTSLCIGAGQELCICGSCS